MYRFAILISAAFIFCSCTKKSIEQQYDVFSLPEGFEIEEVVSSDMISYPMFASFDGDGRLYVCEATEVNSMTTEEMISNPSYHIRLLEDTNGDGYFDKSSIFVDNIPLPMGGVFFDGSFYVAVSPHLMKYTDTDGDGVSDKEEIILEGWVPHANAATLHGPFMGPDGWLYLCDARRGFDITSKEGRRMRGGGARIWRCKPDGSGLEWISGGGFDNAIELIFMPGGETIGTMTYFTDPKDGMRDALMHWVEGGVYPKPNAVIEEDGLKLTGELMPVMTKLPRIAHSGLLRYEGSGLGEEYNGNLFSAVFNTGKVIRHQIFANGATFKTMEEDFLTANSDDIHPTDVLQDADGSLLVVVTGGWFIQGCPLSRVAKPDVRGGIYRVRKKGMAGVSDPWGKKIDFNTLASSELVRYLSDTRIKVRERAIEQMISNGEESVFALKEILSTDNEENRITAVFALGRIGTPSSISVVRNNGLEDESVAVRTASVRILGLERDLKSVERLKELVVSDVAPVRRQAATALEQIGDSEVVPALLEAARKIEDRFVEHTITHALIQLQQPELLLSALQSSFPSEQKIALIALDQMENSPLQPDHLQTFLDSKEPELRNTGIWVATHRPEWSHMIVEFIGEWINNIEITEKEESELQDLITKFSSEVRLQNFLSDYLVSREALNRRKSLVLAGLSNSSVNELPLKMKNTLRQILLSGDAEVKLGVLGLIESRSISDLNDILDEIIMNPNEIDDFRIRSLNARIMSEPILKDQEFRIVMEYLDSRNSSPIRQAAARLLSRVVLSKEQLIEISKIIERMDSFLIPNLIEIFENQDDIEVGKHFINALNKSVDHLDNLSEQDLKIILSSYPEEVQEEAIPLLRKLEEKQLERLTKLNEMEQALMKGDIIEGKKIFFEKGTCSTCHAVGGEGGDFGPDLSNIGEIRSRHDILEAIVYPSASFAREYETYKINTKGRNYIGIIAEQDPQTIDFAVGPGPVIKIPKDEILSIEPHNVSTMPPGLDRLLSNKELADLMSYLEALPDPYKSLR